MMAEPRRTVREYIWPHRAGLLQGGFLLLLTNALDKTIPVFLKDAVDALVGGQLSSVARTALFVAVLAIGMGFVRTASRTRIFNIGRDVEFRLRNDILRQLHRLGPSFFAKVPTGETMSRAISDLAQVRAMIGFGLMNCVNSGFAYLFALVYMLACRPTDALGARSVPL